MGAMALSEQAERRALPRFDSRELEIWLRPRGRLARHSGLVQDFNRHGFSIIVEHAIAKDVQVFVSLSLDDVHLDNVVGVVHNCINMDDRFRVGVQFRTKSDLQFDQKDVENALQSMEGAVGKS